jgi:hypothetical protein
MSVNRDVCPSPPRLAAVRSDREVRELAIYVLPGQPNSRGLAGQVRETLRVAAGLA